jgi:hypothetical protein
MEIRPDGIAWLRRAHAGELGAALAYRGHALSVRNTAERARILEILLEELAHRGEAGLLLKRCGSRPDRRLAMRIARIGRVAGIACRFTGHFTGHFLPMFGAALAEAVNVWEYARLTVAAGNAYDIIDFATRAMAIERGHATWFFERCLRHRGMLSLALVWMSGRRWVRRSDQLCLSTSSAVLVTGST